MALVTLVIAPLLSRRTFGMFTTSSNIDGRKHLRIALGLPAVTVAGCMLGLLLAGLAAVNRQQQIRREAVERFERIAERLATEVQRRINLPAYGLKGARGVYAASKSVERLEFRSYVASRELNIEFPGTLGMGFIQRVGRSELAAFEAAERQDDAPTFMVRADAIATRTTEPDCFVVKFVDPLTCNQGLSGADLGADPACRSAMETALRTGEPTLSGRLALPSVTPADFIYIVPVFKNGLPATNPDERARALDGFVFAPLSLTKALEGVVGGADANVRLRIFDGDSLAPSNLLLDSSEESSQNRASFTSCSTTLPIDVGGRRWLLAFESPSSFEPNLDHLSPTLVGGGGAALTLVLTALAWSILRSRARAMSLATAMTMDFRRAKEEAELLSTRSAIEQERLELALAGSGQGTWDWNPQTGAVLFDDRYAAMLGESALTSSEEAWSSRIHLDDRPAVFAAVQAHLNGAPGKYDCTYRMRHHDGSWRWIKALGRSIRRDDAGNVVRMVGISSDVTLQHDAEEKIASANAMVRRTGEMAQVGGWEYELGTECLIWSDTVYKIHEIDVGVTISLRRAIDFYATAARPIISAAIDRCLSGGPGWDLELPLVTAQGRSIWVRAQGDAIRRDGKIERLAGAFQDITERKRVEERLTKQLVDLAEAKANGEQQAIELAVRAAQLEQLSAAAESATHAKSEFLANMSHEIRTPLTAILGYADLLREEGAQTLTPDSRRHMLDIIQSAGNHLLTIINDILDLSKIEAGKMTIESIETPILVLLDEMDRMIRGRASSKGLGLRIELASPLPDRILTDPTRLRQILMNLVGNAIKFTERGEVTITARVMAAGCSSCTLAIDVNDTGPGMDGEQAARLFGAFVQADATVTRHHGGTGLGLAISRRLAELMGGGVELIRSAPGQGSCFRLTLPLRTAPGAVEVASVIPPRRAPDGHAAQPTPGLSGRILLAEDGIDNQRLIALHLRRAGATVEIADNGRVALSMIQAAHLRALPFDLLLTDMQMPEMDGYSLARSLRGMGSTLPIVALTAHAMAEDATKCLDAGCNAYATKPIVARELLAICATWMARPKVHSPQ